MGATPTAVPILGTMISIILQMATFSVLTFCITRRTQWIKKWSQLPLAQWLILLIYFDSALFVFASSISLHGFSINTSEQTCEGAILLCLLFYMSTKILIYYFLVERAYIVSGNSKPRLQTKLWLFNCLFMILPYSVLVVLNFIFRISYIDGKGVCIIGMQKISMMPLIIFEVVVNVYLTLLFVVPLRKLYSYKTNTNPALKRMAMRSFIGSYGTLATSIANLTMLMVLKGEPAWICITCCNADILSCIAVLHWVTSREEKYESSTVRSSRGATGRPRDVATATLGSMMSRSQHISLGDGEDEDKSPISKNGHMHGVVVDQDTVLTKGLALNNGLKPGIVTTECVSDQTSSGPAAFSRYRRKSEWHIGSNEGQMDPDMELRNIHVQTVQTMEVEEGPDEDRKRSFSASASTDREADEWSRRGVVVERMV